MDKVTITRILLDASDKFGTRIQGVCFNPIILHTSTYVCGLKKVHAKLNYMVQLASFPPNVQLTLSNSLERMWVAEGALDSFIFKDTLALVLYKINNLDKMYLLNLSYTVDGNSSEINESLLFEERKDAEEYIFNVRVGTKSFKCCIDEVERGCKMYITEEEMLKDLTT